VLPCSTYAAHTATGATPPATPRVGHPGEPRHPCAPPYPFPSPSLSISLSPFVLVKPRAELEHEQSSSPFAAPAFPITLPSIPRASAISYPSSTFPKLWSRYSPAKPLGIKGARPATMDAPLQASARASIPFLRLSLA